MSDKDSCEPLVFVLHPLFSFFSGENMYLDLPLIKKLMTFSRKIFQRVAYGFTAMPTYTGGHIGFVMCTCNPVSIQTKRGKDGHFVLKFYAEIMRKILM